MDPQKVWRQLCSNLRHLGLNHHDPEARHMAIEGLETLAEWLRQYGFAPEVGHEQE